MKMRVDGYFEAAEHEDEYEGLSAVLPRIVLGAGGSLSEPLGNGHAEAVPDIVQDGRVGNERVNVLRQEVDGAAGHVVVPPAIDLGTLVNPPRGSNQVDDNG